MGLGQTPNTPPKSPTTPTLQRAHAHSQPQTPKLSAKTFISTKRIKKVARTDVAAPQNKAPAGLSNKQPPGGHHAAQQTPNLRRPPAPGGGVRGGSEAQEEGQVHGVGDAELVQVHRGGDEGQVDGEEVAGVHQQLAGPPLLLLLQSLLQGTWHRVAKWGQQNWDRARG